MKKILFTALKFLTLGTFIIYGVFYYYSWQKSQELEKQQAAVLSTATQPIEILADFSEKIADGSPLVFGGAHGPRPGQTDAWDKIADAGFTVVRRDLFIDSLVPNTTIEDYKNNVNNVQDISTWNKKGIEDALWYYKNAKQRGMKTVAIMAYTPGWLTYSSPYGVPKDWDVYQDIAKKSYMLLHEYIDYVEIWNEPNLDFFMNIKGSPYTREQAYKLFFMHAHKGIRDAEKELNISKPVPIGGGVLYIPNDSKFASSILEDEYFRNNINFFSYHNYEHIPEPTWNTYRDLLDARGKSNIPLAVTEWNIWTKMKVPSRYIVGEESIVYTATKLLGYMKNNIFMSNYFSLQPLEPDSKWGNYGYLGIFYWKNNIAEMSPVAKTYRLLSKSMGLGNGKSTIYKTSDNEKIRSMAFYNNSQKYGVVLINTSSTYQVAAISFKSVPSAKNKEYEVYVASKDNQAREVLTKAEGLYKNGVTRYVVAVPQNSVVGVISKENKDWLDFLR